MSASGLRFSLIISITADGLPYCRLPFPSPPSRSHRLCCRRPLIPTPSPERGREFPLPLVEGRVRGIYNLFTSTPHAFNLPPLQFHPNLKEAYNEKHVQESKIGR